MNRVEQHFDDQILPCLREYDAAERALTRALSGELAQVSEQRALVLRRARAAAIDLHQFTDLVVTAVPAPSWLPPGSDLKAARAWVEGFCIFGLDGDAVRDITLLGDVADAFKHFVLRSSAREVSYAGQVVQIETGFGNLRWGEGKFGGGEQVIVRTCTEGERALSSILFNATNAWLRAMGRDIDPYVMSPS
jgi:hypothetical protein